MNSDSRKAWGLGFFTGIYTRSRHDYDYYINPSVEFRPSPNLSLSVGPNLYWGESPVQYVGAYADSTAAATFGTRYVFAHLSQTEVSAGVRMNWTFSPALSLQLYAQPLISAGRYDEFRQLARPRSYAFTPATEPYNPDFNFRSLRRPGPGAAPSARCPKSSASSPAGSSGRPCASPAATAADSVHPVPCVEVVSMRGRENRRASWAVTSTSTTVSPARCPPFTS